MPIKNFIYVFKFILNIKSKIFYFIFKNNLFLSLYILLSLMFLNYFYNFPDEGINKLSKYGFNHFDKLENNLHLNDKNFK